MTDAINDPSYDIQALLCAHLGTVNEPLLPELEACIMEGSTGMKMIHHPLVVTLFVRPFAGAYNAQFLHNKERLKDAEDHERWGECVFIHERPYRLDAFLKYKDRLPDQVAGDLLTEVWKDIEGPGSSLSTFVMLFNFYAPKSPIMRNSLKCISSERFEVYRGMGTRERSPGMSWTLDRTVARWFARRFGSDDGLVATAMIHPKHVFAYLPERSEQEIVLDPSKLGKISFVKASTL